MIGVGKIADHDEKVRGSLYGKYPGGIVGNFCSASATFGTDTGIITLLGEDEFGDLCLDDFVRRGVDTTGVKRVPGASTYFSVVFLDETGEKALTVVETPIMMPGRGDLDLTFLASAEYVHLCSLSFDLIEYVCKKLENSPVRLSVDLEAHTDNLNVERWQYVFSRLSVLFTNPAALGALFGTPDSSVSSEDAERILGYGSERVVVTAGRNGSVTYTRSGSSRQPAFRVRVADSTGAGDCHNAVYLASIAEGLDERRSARYAAAAAALSIQHIGARTGFPTRKELDGFLSSSPATISSKEVDLEPRHG